MDVVNSTVGGQAGGSFSAAARDAGASLLENLSIPAPFPDPALEALFLEDHSRRFCAFRRASALLALVIWIAYFCWDISLALQNKIPDGTFADLLVLRLLGVALLLGVGILVFRPSFRFHATAHRVILIAVYGLIGLLLAMVAMTPAPFNYTQYFTGICIALFFEFSFFYLKSKSALTVAVITLVVLMALQALHGMFSPDAFVAVLFHLLNVIVVGHGVCVHAERVSRERYLAERALASLNGELLATNLELERKNRALEVSKRDLKTRTNALLFLKDHQMRVAEAASREKSSFLAAATHDLRQPMHALNLFLPTAAEAIRNNDFAEARRLIEASERSSAILARLLNAVLDLSRLDSGRIAPRYQIFDLNANIEETAEQLRSFALSCGVDLRLHLPKDTRVCVRSDPHLLGRAIANLVSNAIKYANVGKTAKPTVIVGVIRSASRARIDVVDNGIGISAEYLDAIFQPFFQIGNPEQDREKGLGLGLSIVNAIVSMLDGHRIELKSAEGSGSRFSVELPLCGAAADHPPPCSPQRMNASDTASLEGLYVLLVEDDNLVRAATEALLSKWGVLFDSLATFDEYAHFLESIERYPELIITDYRLRDYRTARDVAMLATLRLGQSFPCLVVTGEPFATIVPLACDHDVLSKPVSPAELRRAVVSLVAGEHPVLCGSESE